MIYNIFYIYLSICNLCTRHLIISFPLSLLFSWLNSPTSLGLSSIIASVSHHLCGSSLDSPVCPCLSCSGAQNWTQYSTCGLLTSAEQMGRTSSLGHLLGNTLSNVDQCTDTLAWFVTRAHSWLKFNFSLCQLSSCKAPYFLMTFIQTVHVSRCPRLCPGADGTSRFCSLTTSLGAGSWCAKSALLVCSCDPGSGCCEDNYIVRSSCQKFFCHLPNSFGNWSGPCPCSLPEFSLLTCPGFVWRSGLCLILTQPNFLHSPCWDNLGLHAMRVRALLCQGFFQLPKSASTTLQFPDSRLTF